MKKIFAILFSVLFMNSVAHAGWGVSFMAGQVSTSGTENEKSGDVGPEKNSKDITETFYGASIFVEGVADNGLTVGIDYVPLALELGSGQRTDSSTGADAASEADTGTRKASADLEHLITLYTNIPMGGNDGYGLLGLHYAELTTSETLVNSSYGDENIFGAQIGYGVKKGNLKYELSYSDFESISLSSSSGSSTVSADADALTFKIAYGF
tara:strand:+ start:189 stop:821 length:633 start_codon:yes stop_codon:yes gene_type:complete